MKKWENPSLLTLGLENTYSVECYSAEKHGCHKTGNGEHAGQDNVDVPGGNKGHIANVACPDGTHEGYCCCIPGMS